MHRYRIVAQISLILSIFNLVLATPIVVREIHDARNDEKVVAGNVAATPTSAGSSPDAMATPQHDPSLLDGDEARNDGTVIAEDVAATQTSAGSSPDATAPPQHHPSLLDGDEARNDGTVIADDVAATQMSAGSSPDAIAPPQHHPSLSDGSVSPGYPAPYLSEGSSASGNSLRVNPPGSWHEPALYNPINTAPSTPSWASPTWWPPGGPPGDWPSSTPESSVISIPDWLGLGSPPPPDDAKFFNKNMMKKLKIAAGVIIVGGAIAAIVGSQIKHRNKHREYQDS